MTTLITITVSGAADGDRTTVAHTICQALKEAALDVRGSPEELPIALTTLYEQQIRLAMAGTQCVVKTETSHEYEQRGGYASRSR